MGLAKIVAYLRKYGLVSIPEELASDNEEQVEVFIGLFSTKTTAELIAITRSRLIVPAAREAARLLLLKRVATE